MLDKGNIIEEGTPCDLTSKSISYYAGLVTTAGIMLQNKNLSNKKQNTQFFIIALSITGVTGRPGSFIHLGTESPNGF